jgi:hypothetical protein
MFGLADASGNGSVTANGTDGIFLWGAQLEQRSAPTAYQVTTTQPITNYIPVLQTAAAGVARFDHNPITGESLGLLIEEQRTNLVTRSEEFNDAAWTKSGATVTANTTIAPDGALTGDILVENTSNSTHFFQRDQSITAGSGTYSFYAKAAGRSQILVRDANVSSTDVTYDLVNGTTSNVGASATATITNVGNGWYRCAHTCTRTTTAATRVFMISSGNLVYTGDGYSGIYIWGAQLEAGAFQTSYAPTVASQVTRSADAASMTGANFSSWYRADESTLFFDSVNQSGARAIAGLGQGSFATNIVFNNTNLIRSAGATPTLTVGTAVAAPVKLAAASKPGDFAASANGAAAVTNSTNLTIQRQANQLQIGSSDGSGVLNGAIKKLAFYPERLSDAQLQALTQN